MKTAWAAIVGSSSGARGDLCGAWSRVALSVLALTAFVSAGCDQAAPPSSSDVPAALVSGTLASDVPTATLGEPATNTRVPRPEVKVAAHIGSEPGAAHDFASPTVPAWAADAVFYQIFPDRFCNGDPSNDPTRESLEAPEKVPDSWAISPWTGDWYARADWEKQLGGDFYEDGVFHRRYGGDLQGVIDKLGYLESLGINAIYFNPVFYGRSLHKYDGNTFHHIDPYFGPDPQGDLQLMARETSDPSSWQWTRADQLFLELLREAHARGIRIIIDGVFNHTGRDFFAFADLRRNQEKSPYRDWYIVQSFDDPATPQDEFRYKGWWGVETLPEFADNDVGNDLHRGPKQYVFDITSRWMDPNGDGDPSDGIDGWRLDVANEVPIRFWRDWHAHVRQINPESYTVAEMWGNARHFLEEGRFSATMNYHGFAFPTKGFLIDGVLTASGAAREFDTRRLAYSRPMQFALQNLIDSHDTDRLASMIVNAGRRPYAQPQRFDYDIGVSPRYMPDYDVRKPEEKARRIQRLVALLQMTYVGAPLVYYGTEAGMWGPDDPGDRMPMVWPDLTYDPQQADPLGRPRKPDTVAFDGTLFAYYRSAIWLRRQQPVLRHGDIEFTNSDDTAQFLAFRRFDGDDTLLVGLNRGKGEYRWDIPLPDQHLVSQVFTASGDVDRFQIENLSDRAVVTIPAVDGVVLRLEPRE